MDRRYARLILNIVIPVAEILLLCLLGPKLLKFFMPFVIGWIIAMIANPLVRFLESRVKLVQLRADCCGSAGFNYRTQLFSRLQADFTGYGADKRSSGIV